MRRSGQSIYAYLGAGLAIAIVAIVLVSGFAASRQNELSLNAQKVVARHDASEVFDSLYVTLMQVAFWQEAYEKIGRNWDQKWIDFHFGSYLDLSGIHLAAIFGPDDRLRFLYTGGRDARVTRETMAKAQGLTTLLKTVRAAPVRQPPALHEGMVIIAGAPYFATAGIVTPEKASDLPIVRARQFMAVFFSRMTIADFGALTGGFGVKDVRISRDGNVSKRLAAIALPDAAGKPLAWLEWDPVLPGADFLKAIIPAMIVVFLLLALVQGIVVRRWQILQRRLFTAEAKVVAAEEESRIKSVFLGMVSHELRTPLNAIIGFSDVLLHRTFGPLGSPRYEEYAGHIQAGGQALLKIVNDLIEIVRIEAHDTAIECECLDAAHGAQLAIETVRERAAAKKIKLVYDAVAGNAWCEASPLSLCNAIERVLDNAIRHSKEDASVVVSAMRLENEVVVAVRDTGDGISAERLADLGKPFGLAKSHLISGNGGAGLGLSIVKGLMRLMGGSLSIASEEGVGTTVTLHLRAAEAPLNFKEKAA